MNPKRDYETHKSDGFNGEEGRSQMTKVKKKQIKLRSARLKLISMAIGFLLGLQGLHQAAEGGLFDDFPGRGGSGPFNPGAPSPPSIPPPPSPSEGLHRAKLSEGTCFALLSTSAVKELADFDRLVALITTPLKTLDIATALELGWEETDCVGEGLGRAVYDGAVSTDGLCTIDVELLDSWFAHS
jgi:hypothetical protein